MTGQVIGNYRIVDRLGHGGVGKVYLAIDTMVEREVAIKALHPEIAHNQESLERFRTEAVTLAKLNHPGIAQLYSFFRDQDNLYMVMEYVPGRNLEQVIREDGAMPWPKAFNLVAEALDALSFAHKAGILHRDIKPSNMILTPEGRVKIMDFGIAQALGGPKMTREGRIVGTLEYLAPERIQGKPPDARADLYAMGIVLYELLTARLPFSATSEYEIMQAQLTKRPATPREMGIGLPAQVEQAVLQALEKDPEKRFADASTFAAALRRLAAAVPVAAPAAPNEPWWQSRQTLQIAWAAALALLLLTAGVLVWSRLRPSPVQEAWKQPPPQVVDQPSGPVVNPAPAPAPLNIDTTPIPVTPQPAEPTPTPVLRPPQTNPVRPVAQVPKVQPAGLTADQRRVVLEALDRTDGPVNGPPGMRPIHLTGLVSALKVGGPPSLAELTESVKRRGVNFPLTPAAASSLRESGADAVLIGAVESGYRPTVAAAPPVATPAPSPKPAAPEPAPKAASRTIQSIRDVKELYVEKLPSELDDYIRAEIEIRLSGRIKLAPSADKADAIMQVSITEPETGKIKRAGRILGIRDKNRAQARIVDRVTHVVLWEETAGDRSLMTGSLIGDGVKRVAARIVKALQDDLRR